MGRNLFNSPVMSVAAITLGIGIPARHVVRNRTIYAILAIRRKLRFMWPKAGSFPRKNPEQR
jgi:hypothetical protein